MAWAIAGSNVDVDIDVNFREDAHIGYKMSVIYQEILLCCTLLPAPHVFDFPVSLFHSYFLSFWKSGHLVR